MIDFIGQLLIQGIYLTQNWSAPWSLFVKFELKFNTLSPPSNLFQISLILRCVKPNAIMMRFNDDDRTASDLTEDRTVKVSEPSKLVSLGRNSLSSDRNSLINNHFASNQYLVALSNLSHSKNTSPLAYINARSVPDPKWLTFQTLWQQPINTQQTSMIEACKPKLRQESINLVKLFALNRPER